MEMSFFQPGATLEDVSQKCPLCGQGQPESLRYPRYLCINCLERAVDAEGRILRFGNEGPFGGLRIEVQETGESLDDSQCWIDGVPCEASEARFGGIVVEPVEKE